MASADGDRDSAAELLAREQAEAAAAPSIPYPAPPPAPPTAPAPPSLPSGGDASEDPRATDLSAFHQYASFERRVRGEFTKVRKLVKAIHGTVYMFKWERSGQAPTEAVVKCMRNEAVRLNLGRETNEMCAHLAEGRASVPPGSPHSPCAMDRIPHQEDALNEIGVITYLSRQHDCPRYLLRMIDSFVDGPDTWLVTEYADGGEFFEQVASRSIAWTEDRNRNYMWQLLQAVRYLHSHDIGHRDISLENILISFRRDPPDGERIGEFRLMDFGGACRTRLREGGPLCRYFRLVGKAYYRAPECLVPAALETQVIAPPNIPPHSVIFTRLIGPEHRGYVCEVRLPAEVTPGQPCTAQLWGYTVPAMDAFACGVCLFIISWGIPPWQAARCSDQLFSFIASRGDQGIPSLLKQWGKTPLSQPAMDLLIRMCRIDPARRPSVETCLGSDWFAPLSGQAVPVQSASDEQQPP